MLETDLTHDLKETDSTHDFKQSLQGYQFNAELQFHTESPSRVAIYNFTLRVPSSVTI